MAARRGLLLLRASREHAHVVDVPRLAVTLRSMMIVSERPHWYAAFACSRNPCADAHASPCRRVVRVCRDLGVLLTDSDTVTAYNTHFRGKDRATDILSFPFHDVRTRPLTRSPVCALCV